MRFMAWGRWGARRRNYPRRNESSTGSRVSSLRKRVTLVAIVALFVLTVITLAADALLRPSIYAWAQTKAVQVATSAIAHATREHLLPNLDSSQLFEAITDEEGQLVLIDYNMHRLNQLRAQTAFYIQQSLAEQTEGELHLPLGLLTGVDFLAGFGPRIPVRIVPVGAVTTLPRSDFTSGGINMINHRLYVYIRIVVKVVAPNIDIEIPVEQDVVLTNQVIPGKVPNVFVGIEGLDLGSLVNGQFAVPSGR